jgi:purine-binding chemotaxis protein CheW
MATPAVVFPIGLDRYAIATSVVREVVADPIPTAMPTSPAALLGAFNLRGEVIPMFDTALLLGIGAIGSSPVAIVVDTTAGPAGLAVGGLPQFAVLDVEIAASELRGAVGVFDVDGAVVVMLDVERMLVTQPPGSDAGSPGLTRVAT